MSRAFVWPNTTPFFSLCSVQTQQRESRPAQAKTISHAHWKEWCSSIFSLSPPPPHRKTAFVHIYAWLVSYIDAHLCLSSTWQLFFLLPKITFIISVSNTYWPAVSLWHIPAAHNHGCLLLSIHHDLLAPFFIHRVATPVGRRSHLSTECRAAIIHQTAGNQVKRDVHTRPPPWLLLRMNVCGQKIS